MEVKALSLRKVVGGAINLPRGVHPHLHVHLHQHHNNTMKEEEEEDQVVIKVEEEEDQAVTKGGEEDLEVTKVEEPGRNKDHRGDREAMVVVAAAVAVGCHHSSNMVMVGPLPRPHRPLNSEVDPGVVREEEVVEELAAVEVVVAVGEEDLLLVLAQLDHRFPTCTKRPLLRMLLGSLLKPQALHPPHPMSLNLQYWWSLCTR